MLQQDGECSFYCMFHTLVYTICLTLVSMVLLAVPCSEPVDYAEEEHQQKSEIVKVCKYCHERSKSVEVLYQNLDGEKILFKVHFRYDPAVSTLG